MLEFMKKQSRNLLEVNLLLHLFLNIVICTE